MCFFVSCNRHWFNKGPDLYLPLTISSDAGYVDLPPPLLGAPVSIGALVKLGSRSRAEQDRDWSSRPPGQDYMYPFGVIGVAPRYIPAGAVIELAGFRLGCTSTPTDIRETQAGGNRIQGHLSRGGPESRTFPSKVIRGLHPASP